MPYKKFFYSPGPLLDISIKNLFATIKRFLHNYKNFFLATIKKFPHNYKTIFSQIYKKKFTTVKKISSKIFFLFCLGIA